MQHRQVPQAAVCPSTHQRCPGKCRSVKPLSEIVRTYISPKESCWGKREVPEGETSGTISAAPPAEGGYYLVAMGITRKEISVEEMGKRAQQEQCGGNGLGNISGKLPEAAGMSER